MSAEIVNLRQFKKGKVRQEKAGQAEQNRISFGRTKSEKQLTKSINDKAQKTLDQGKLEKPFRDKD
jgi:hypothetical protein